MQKSWSADCCSQVMRNEDAHQHLGMSLASPRFISWLEIKDEGTTARWFTEKLFKC